MLSSKRPRIAISAASSFTGSWIARAFHAAGWKVLPVCSQPASAYRGIRRKRIELVQECVSVHFDCEASDGSLAAWIKEHRPQIWIHHHHFMEDFRSVHYDLRRALSIGLGSLPGILDAFAAGDGVGVIYSGTYFEQSERGQAWQDSTPTPYAQSKTQVWEALCFGCEKRELGLSKIVIPNPVGPWENQDRLIPCMIDHAESGAALQLRSPRQLVDNIPIDELAALYVESARQLLSARDQKVIRPSGRISSALNWIEFAGKELLEKRLGLPPCKLEYERSSVKACDDTLTFTNPGSEAKPIDWNNFWDSYAANLRRR